MTRPARHAAGLAALALCATLLVACNDSEAILSHPASPSTGSLSSGRRDSR